MEIGDTGVKVLRKKDGGALLGTREVSLDQKHVSRLAAEDDELIRLIDHERCDCLLIDFVEDLEAAHTERTSVFIDGVQQEQLDRGVLHGEIGSEGLLDLQVFQHPLVGFV